jgi:DNA repair photolyase
MTVTETTVKNILTRTTGYLRTVTSHSLQPYRGCSYGNSLCGVGCYVRHNGHVLRGREWGSFLEVRINAAESYLANYDCEARWARREGGEFAIFCSSSTDPFVPQEQRYGVTAGLLDAMIARPPDELVMQTHSHLVTRELPRLHALSQLCRVRVHVSIETDRERVAGLPPHASPVERRLQACGKLRGGGVFTVVTVAPLLPIADPDRFFARIAAVADGVVLDHFIGGDGSPDGSRTLATDLPGAIAALDPAAMNLSYRERMAGVARRHMGRVGVGASGFAGRYQRLAGSDCGGRTLEITDGSAELEGISTNPPFLVRTLSNGGR